MLAFSTPTMYTFIFQQLQSSQTDPTEKPVEPVVVASINEGENDFRIVEMEYEEIVCRRQAKK